MKQPNIVFILTDDQGAWAMRCAGNSDVITPNLDRLAKKGTRFDNFFCASPVCSPARASILTGQMPSCHGVQDWLRGGNLDMAAQNEQADVNYASKPDVAIEYLEGYPSYVSELADLGYRCGLSGKWHLGNSVKPKHGFEKWWALTGGGCNYYEGVCCSEGAVAPVDGYITDAITDHALEMLDDFLGDTDHPFYLSVHFTAPHSPWEANHHPNDVQALYQDCSFTATPELAMHADQINTCPYGDTPAHRRENLTGYYTAITAMDANVGRILDRIESSGASDNTIIIFTADNGMNMGHHGIWGKGNGTYPPNMYDTSVKVPFIFVNPRATATGVVESSMLNHCDLFPTLLELAGSAPTLAPYQTGCSFAPLFYDQPIQQKEDIFVCDEYGFVRMLRTRNHKLIANYNDGSFTFYDLVADPDEQVNCIDNPKYGMLIASMKEKLEQWFDRYSKPVHDARQFAVTGRGQSDRCTVADAFDQDFDYHHA